MKEIIISFILIFAVGCVTTSLRKEPMVTCILAKCKIETVKEAPEKAE